MDWKQYESKKGQTVDFKKLEKVVMPSAEEIVDENGDIISEAKAEGKTIPGRVPLPGVRSYVWNPIIFHDQYLLPKIHGPVRNEYEQRDHLLIINNLKKRKVS